MLVYRRVPTENEHASNPKKYTKYLASQRVCDPFLGPGKKNMTRTQRLLLVTFNDRESKRVNFESLGLGKSTNFGNHNPLIRPAISWGNMWHWGFGASQKFPLQITSTPSRCDLDVKNNPGVATPQLPGDVSLVGRIGVQRKNTWFVCL